MLPQQAADRASITSPLPIQLKNQQVHRACKLAAWDTSAQHLAQSASCAASTTSAPQGPPQPLHTSASPPTEKCTAPSAANQDGATRPTSLFADPCAETRQRETYTRGKNLHPFRGEDAPAHEPMNAQGNLTKFAD